MAHKDNMGWIEEFTIEENLYTHQALGQQLIRSEKQGHYPKEQNKKKVIKC